MNQTNTIAHLAEALVAAQSDFRVIGKDSTNPDYRSEYASLDKIVETIRPTLAKHGLAVVQGAEPDASGKSLVVTTRLLHSSGEWIESSVVMPLVGRMLKGGGRAEPDPQSAGSAVSYGRRYGVSALLSLVTGEDDDGNAASKPARAKAAAKTPEETPASLFFGKPKGTPLGQYDNDALKQIAAWCTARAEREKDAAKTRLEEMAKTARAILADRSLGLDDDSVVNRAVKQEDAFQGALNR